MNTLDIYILKNKIPALFVQRINNYFNLIPNTNQTKNGDNEVI